MIKKSELHIKLYQEATTAMTHAYNPYSKYSVGAALYTTNGFITSGCNVENVSFRLTLCAEANAIGQLIARHGTSTIQEIIIVASGSGFPSPCGACRQIIAEFSTPETAIHLARKKDADHTDFDLRTYRISALLPLSFTQQSMATTEENNAEEGAFSITSYKSEQL